MVGKVALTEEKRDTESTTDKDEWTCGEGCGRKKMATGAMEKQQGVEQQGVRFNESGNLGEAKDIAEMGKEVFGAHGSFC